MNDEKRYPVADVERATVAVLARTPLLCTLDRASLRSIGREVRDGAARRLSEVHQQKTTPPALHGAVLESLKETTLFCVLIGAKLRVLTDHIIREVERGRPEGGRGHGAPGGGR